MRSMVVGLLALAACDRWDASTCEGPTPIATLAMRSEAIAAVGLEDGFAIVAIEPLDGANPLLVRVDATLAVTARHALTSAGGKLAASGEALYVETAAAVTRFDGALAPVWSTPAVSSADDMSRTLVVDSEVVAHAVAIGGVPTGRGFVELLDAASGARRWQVDTDEDIRDVAIAPGGDVYLASSRAVTRLARADGQASVVATFDQPWRTRVELVADGAFVFRQEGPEGVLYRYDAAWSERERVRLPGAERVFAFANGDALAVTPTAAQRLRRDGSVDEPRPTCGDVVRALDAADRVLFARADGVALHPF